MEAFKTVDRNGEVSELAKNYGPRMRALASLLSEHRAHTAPGKLVSKLVLEVTASASDLLAFYAEHASDKALQSAYLNEGHNQSDMHGAFSDSRFYGMSSANYVKEIRGESSVLRGQVEKAMEELAKSGVRESLEQEMIGARKRRKRVFSDCEGSYHYERRFDDAPFSRIVSNSKEFPHIELIYPIGMNCTASVEAISKFNARCLALADILEGAGYRVGIVAEGWSLAIRSGSAATQRIGGASQSYTYSMTRVKVREANEYGNIVSYAPIACAEFFRRAMFATTMGANQFAHGLKENLGTVVKSGVGYSQKVRPIPAEVGQLVLDHAMIERLFSLSEAERKAIISERIKYTLNGLPQAS